MANKDYKAFIVEGEVREPQVIDNISKIFFSHKNYKVITLPAGENIYMLWKQLKADNFDTDVIEVLRESNVEIKKQLMGLSREDFSEVYLFFDYDAHQTNLGKAVNEDVIRQMLESFDNETENGKLYISYPMVEAIKEIEISTEDYHKLHIPLDEIAQYKGSFQESSDYENYPTITRKMWEVACKASVKQANIIVKQTGIVSYEKFINECTQLEIYHAQKLYYINAYKLIAILSSIPLFLIEYFDKDFWNEVIT